MKKIIQPHIPGNKQTTLDSFNFIKKLGEGTYSTVYQVIRKDDNKEYALKYTNENAMKVEK